MTSADVQVIIGLVTVCALIAMMTFGSRPYDVMVVMGVSSMIGAVVSAISWVML